MFLRACCLAMMAEVPQIADEPSGRQLRQGSATNCREHAHQRVRSELDAADMRNSREGRTGTDAKLNR